MKTKDILYNGGDAVRKCLCLKGLFDMVHRIGNIDTATAGKTQSDEIISIIMDANCILEQAGSIRYLSDEYRDTLRSE